MKKKFLIFSLVALGLIILAGSLSIIFQDKMDNAVIKTDNYEGVILSEPKMSTWTPDREIVDVFESELLSYLNKLAQNKELDSGITSDMSGLSYICKNIKNYKRQYIGMTVDGNKVIFCNFITLIDDDLRNSWENKFINMLGGGPDFFQIEYKLEKKKYFNLLINESE